MEEVANDQGRALELECDKRLDATRTLKNSKADLLKAKEDLKEITRARDSVELGLVSAQKQAKDQARCLLEAKDQLKIAKEQITDLKKKLAEAKGAKNVTKWARDEALRAPRRRLRRRLMTWEWLRPRPFSRLKSLGYAGSTIPRFGMRPLSMLGLRLHPTYERWRMYTTLLPSGKLPPPAPGTSLRRLRLLVLRLLWLQPLLMS